MGSNISHLAGEIEAFNIALMSAIVDKLSKLTNEENVFLQVLRLMQRIAEDNDRQFHCLLEPAHSLNSRDCRQAWSVLLADVPEAAQRQVEYRVTFILRYFGRGAQYDPLDHKGISLAVLFNLLRALTGRVTEEQKRTFFFPQHNLSMGLLHRAFRDMSDDEPLNIASICAVLSLIPTADTLALITFLRAPHLDQTTLNSLSACYAEQRKMHGMDRSIVPD